MKVSELIQGLQSMKETYGDLKVVIAVSSPANVEVKSTETVMSSEDLYIGYDQCSDREDEISIRDFPY